MHYLVRGKHCVITQAARTLIERHIRGTVQYISRMSSELSRISIVIERSKPRQGFHGAMSMMLPRHSLFVTFSAATMESALKVGFTKLQREIQTYRGKHFVGDSAYKNRETIRMRQAE